MLTHDRKTALQVTTKLCGKIQVSGITFKFGKMIPKYSSTRYDKGNWQITNLEGVLENHLKTLSNSWAVLQMPKVLFPIMADVGTTYMLTFPDGITSMHI